MSKMTPTTVGPEVAICDAEGHTLIEAQIPPGGYMTWGGNWRKASKQVEEQKSITEALLKFFCTYPKDKKMPEAQYYVDSCHGVKGIRWNAPGGRRLEVTVNGHWNALRAEEEDGCWSWKWGGALTDNTDRDNGHLWEWLVGECNDLPHDRSPKQKGAET